ncbi:MAG TPA: hypothetical protein VKZ59_07505 [Acidobacteriota bacterium]|nr:hypothetical protein [Acidobacteriota bacterium]
MELERRFIFRGNAVAAAGHINFPEEQVIPTQGVSALPTNGGLSESNIGRSQESEYFSFEASHTRAYGTLDPKTQRNTTSVTATIKGVNITGRLRCESMGATLISNEGEREGQPAIIPEGSFIKGMFLDDYPVTVSLDIALFTHMNTKERLSYAYGNDDAFFLRYGKRFLSAEKPDSKPGFLASLFGRKRRREIPEMKGYVVCSLVSEVFCDHPEIKIDGHKIYLPGFGRIFLGELLISDYSRRLTMARVQLGSPVQGWISLAEVESNGHGLP